MPVVKDLLIQHSTYAGSHLQSSTLRKCPLPHLVLSGNTLIVAMMNTSGKTPSSVTDDQSNSYSLAKNKDDSNQNVLIYYCTNITNAPRTVLINWSVAANYVATWVGEFKNIKTSSPIDGTGSVNNAGSGTSLTAGSWTTSENGDLILACATQVSVDGRIDSWTKGSGFTLLAADVEDSFTVEAMIQTTAGAINPAMSMSPSHAWIMVATAFKYDAAQGTSRPSGLRCIGIHHQAVNRDGVGSASDIQYPCFGDTLLIAWNGASSDNLTAVSDGTNTWSSAVSDQTSGGSGHNRAFFAKNITPSDSYVTTLTYGGSGAQPGDVGMFFDFIGGELTDPIGTVATCSGTAATTSITGPSITPEEVGSLIVTQVGVMSNTVISCTPDYFISSTDPNEQISPWDNDQNNWWSLTRTPSLTTINMVGTSNIAVVDFAGFSVEIRAGATTHTVTVNQVSETDLAQAMTHKKTKGLGQISESDTVQPITHVKSHTLGQVTETDTPQSMTHSKIKAIGQVPEINTSQSFSISKRKTLGQIAETDTAQPLTSSGSKLIAIGQASETDSVGALSHSKIKSVAMILESGISQSINRIKLRAIGQCSEIDLAQLIHHGTVRDIGMVTGVDLAQIMLYSKRKTIGMIVGVDFARSITPVGVTVTTVSHRVLRMKPIQRMRIT